MNNTRVYNLRMMYATARKEKRKRIYEQCKSVQLANDICNGQEKEDEEEEASDGQS